MMSSKRNLAKADGISSRHSEAAQSGALALAICGALAGPAVAAQPTPFLLDSTIVGAGATLTVTNLPVATATGSFVYKDLTIEFKADIKGNLTIASGFPKVVPAPTPIVSNFQAGNCAGPATVGNGKYLVTVTGPGIGSGGQTEWSLATAKDANTGPIAANPLATRLKAAGITSTAYSYGVVGGNANFSGCASSIYLTTFPQGGLIGVSQPGASLSIVSFASGNSDSPAPIGQIPCILLQQ